MQIIISEFMSLHGVVQAPGGRTYAQRAGTERPEGESVVVSGPLP